MDDTLNWVPKTLRISEKDSSSLCRIPNPALLIQNLGQFQKFVRFWMVFLEFRSKFTKFRGNHWIPVKLAELLLLIFNVVHGGGGGDLGVGFFWNSPLWQGISPLSEGLASMLYYGMGAARYPKVWRLCCIWHGGSPLPEGLATMLYYGMGAARYPKVW